MELKFFRVLKADPLGDPWTPEADGAKPLQTFWCQFEGVDLPVQMSKQVPNTPSLIYGQFGYLIEKVSQKGTKYYKFKGQKAPEELDQPRYDATDGMVATQPYGIQVPASFGQSSRDFGAEIDALHEEIVNLAEKVEDLANARLTQAEVLKGAVDADKVEATTSEISKEALEEIFGGSMGEIVEIPEDEEKK